MDVKRIWFAIVAIALLTGCMHDETLSPIPEMEEQTIGFATGTNAVTRGEEKGADNSSANEKYGLKNYHDNFSVWGYKFANSSFWTVFEKQLVTWDGSVWDYTPHRYWDKTVKYYNFYACAPADGWTVSNSEVTSMKEETRLMFSYTGYTADGKSLPQSTTNPTSSEKSLFGTDISENNADLMIAHDALRQNENRLNNAVSFEFDHILSRLNIALKKSDELKSAEGVVVKLTELKIVNLMNKGNFNEDLTAPDPDLTVDELKAGTNKRWTANTPNTAGIGVTFDSDGKETDNTYFGTATPTNTIDDDYLYVYQGLVVPQKINYKAYNIRGTDTTMDEAYLKIVYTIDGEVFTRYYNLAEVFSHVNDPYTVNGRTAYKAGIVNVWSADGKTFYADANTETAYDNNQVAYQVEEQTTGGTTTTYWLNYFAADKTQIDRASTGVFYEHGFSDDAHKKPQPMVVVMIADNALVPVLRKEISGLCDVTFCEGWQYNLKMTIGPKAIRFNVSIEEWNKGTDQVFNID